MSTGNGFEIDGYIRAIEKCVYPKIIPSAINHLVYSYYDPWFKLKNIRLSLPHVCSVPSVYHNPGDNKDYFIVIPMAEDSRNIYKYDCINDDWCILTQYPDKFDPICHGAIIEPRNDDLYIFHGQTAILGVYNLQTNEWNVLCDVEQTETVKEMYNVIDSSNPLCVINPNNKDEFYILNEYEPPNIGLYTWIHTRFNIKTLQFTDPSDNHLNTTNDLNGASLIRIKIVNKYILMTFGGFNEDYDYDDRIWYYQCNENKNKNDWKLFPLRVPTKGSVQAVVYGQVIIIRTLNYDNKEYALYYLEINNWENIKVFPDKKTWIKCDLILSSSGTIRLDGNNDLYFMNFSDPLNFCKIHLSRVLPYKLYLKYQ